MKKLIKILLIVICTFLAICQVDNKVYGYTIDEVKDKIDFKIVEESGEPKHYDVMIDARDLIDNEQLPCIETSIESVVYSNDDLFSIDFFGINSSNVSSKWKKFISEPVQAIFKVLLYISLAMMLTLLLYMAVILVRSGISQKGSMLPLSNVFGIGNGKDSPQKHQTEKGFVEQWIVSTILLIFIIYFINLVVSFSNILTNIANEFEPDEDEDNSIVVYVKNSQETVQLSSIIGTTVSSGNVLANDISGYLNSDEASTGVWAVYAKNLSTNTDVVTYNNTNQMPSASVIKLFIAAAAYEKDENDSNYSVNTTDMKNMITVSDNDAANNLIDAVGKDYINSYISDNGYSNTILNRKFGITKFTKDNYTSASDVGKLLEKLYNNECAGSEKIIKYMKQQERRSKIPQGVPSDVTVANKTGELGSEYPNGPVENDAAIVYKEDSNYILVILSSNLEDDEKAISNINEVSARVYNGIDNSTEDDSSSVTGNTTTRTFDYYFKTNLEGLLMFQSQYRWEDYTLKNIINMVTGYIVLILFKIPLYVLFGLRMIIVAVLVAFAPLVIIINAFMKIKGNKGILQTWLKIFLYCVFLKPAISLIYYIFISGNTYTVSEYPFYIIFVILGIIVLFILSLTILLNSIKLTKKKNKIKKKTK